MSPFLLETEKRTIIRPEANFSVQYASESKTFIVIGISFECSGDRDFLQALFSGVNSTYGNDTTWIIVNPDIEVVDSTCAKIISRFPSAKVIPVNLSLEKWISLRTPEISFSLY